MADRLPRFYSGGASFYPGKNIVFIYDEPEHDESKSYGQPLTTPLTIEQLADAVVAKKDAQQTPKELWTDEQRELRAQLVAAFAVLQEVQLAGFEMEGENPDRVSGDKEARNG